MPDEHFGYLLYSLEVAQREFSLNTKFKGHVRQLHLERLEKLISELEMYLPESEKIPLSDNPSTYEKKLIDTWRMDGYSD